MNTIQEKMIQDLESDIAKLEAQLALLKSLPELPSGWHWEASSKALAISSSSIQKVGHRPFVRIQNGKLDVTGQMPIKLVEILLEEYRKQQRGEA